MKQLLLVTLMLFALLGGNQQTCFAQQITASLTDDGAWSVNSQPSAVYSNGKTFFAWVNRDKSLVAASYDHATGTYQEKVVASGFRGDFASPALLVRESGQVLLFASKNEGEAHYYIWVTTNPRDITEWSASKRGTAYGAGGTVPFAVGDDVYILYRSKNNVGVVYAKGLNASTEQTVVAELANGSIRGGLYSIGISGGNDYTVKMDIPYIRACQDSEGAIHIVFSQLANGGTNNKFYGYDKSSIHYVKFVGTSNASEGLQYEMYKADGTKIESISAETPPDVIYSEATGGKKAWAYDIELNETGLPVILYATFNADGTGHAYNQARWNDAGKEWSNSQITDAGDGLPTAEYSANQSKFPAHSYSSGGINFASNDLSTVYLSKRSNTGVFEIYKYTTSDEGSVWQEAEALTSNTASDIVNIRPERVFNAPADYPIDVIWMQGAYNSPVDYSTSVLSRSKAEEVTQIAFEEDEYNFAQGDIEALNVKFSPIFVADKTFTLDSENSEIVRITDDGKVECLAVGTAKIVAKATADNLITDTCEVIVHDKLVFDTFIERIIADIRKDDLKGINALEENIASFINQLQSDGSFPDIDYSATDRTNWPPLTHIDRLLSLGMAYTSEESSYFGNDGLKEKMDKMLEYWQTTKPRSNNWYQNQIAEPQRMGKYLIQMETLGKEGIPEELLAESIARLRDNGGNPAEQAGANRIDVALHYMYRACLTNNRDLLKEAMDYIYSPVEYTAGSEGIQYDNSYTQHGRQLHIGSYGEVFLNGVTKAAMYAVNTEYAMPAEKAEILSKLVKDSYVNVFRGQYISYNVIGRASTRPGATKKTGNTNILTRMKSLDATNAQIYERAIARVTGSESSSYGVTPGSAHYFKSDYTLHKRPKYTVDLRMVSTRTVRNEYLADNGEGIKQYFLSDGSTGIFVNGDEYYNIFPVWNWAKIPGVTCPEFPVIPQATSYIKRGESDFAGGVTDSLTSISVYQYSDTYENINTSAKKAWFFFDKEIVCLGSDIQSTSGYKVNTTVNQSLLNGNIIVSSEKNKSVVTSGDYNYDDNINWVHHNNIAYYFPEKGKIDLSAKEQSGSWTDINTSYTQEGTVTKNVFTLSFDHGTDPVGGEYAYIIVPGISSEEAQSYDAANIEIIVNSDSLQAVYNKAEKVYGLIFHKACGFNKHGLSVESDAGCVVLVKDADKAETLVYVADPKSGSNPINLGISTPAITERRLITYSASEPYLGESVKFVVNENTPLYPGRDVLLSRNDWTIITSIDGPLDDAVGGTEPEYIIDGDEQTSFLFVKPGKSFEGITAAADYIPSFTIDLKEQQEMSFFVYRHRTYNNTLAFLRAKAVSFYGRNTEDEDFVPIVENVSIGTDVSEVKVVFPEEVTYRYVKLVITDWDKTSGSTIQVSEFNIGTKMLTAIPETGGVTSAERISISEGASLLVYPNPVRTGNDLRIKDTDFIDAVFEVFDFTGKLQKKSNRPVINTENLYPGVYFLRVRDKATGKQASTKFTII